MSLTTDRCKTIATARAIGLTIIPSDETRPEVFQQWADRVDWAFARDIRGKLTIGDLIECDRALGIQDRRAA